MGYFEDIYKKRLNRYGSDYQSRTQGQRERFFENYLIKSIYRVDFLYNNEMEPGILEKKSQNTTKLLQHLLVRETLEIPSGTILMIPDKDKIEQPWMIFFLESIKASGYNRYIVLRMNYNITWLARDKTSQTSWAYMYGQEDNMLKNELLSRSRSGTIYTENLKSNFLVMPLNSNLKRDDYLEITIQGIKESYRVTGYDIISTPGVEFVTIDPVYEYDQTVAPTGTGDDYFWLNGGVE